MALVERDGDSHLTEAFSNHSLGSPSAAAASIGAVDAYTTFSQPYTAELPAAAILVAAEPSGAVGLSYRRYVKSTLLPGIRRVAAILRSHAATIEWPSVAWQKEKFPGGPNQSNGYATFWLSALAVADTAAPHDPLPQDLSRFTVRQNDG